MDQPLSAPDSWARLRATHLAVARRFGDLSPEEAFHRSAPGAWRPVDDLAHLTLATWALVRGFSLSGAELNARFDPGEGASRPCAEIAEAGGRALEGGATSPEAMIPTDVSESVPLGERAPRLERALGEWADAAASLEALEERWSEDELDRHRIPHPFLGPLTLREWLCFNHVHARHHLRGLPRRLGRAPTGEG